MKNKKLKAQTISLMVAAMHQYVKRNCESMADRSNPLLFEKICAVENAFNRLSVSARNLNFDKNELNFEGSEAFFKNAA